MERIILEPVVKLNYFKDIENHRLVMIIDKSNCIYLTAQVDRGVILLQMNPSKRQGLNRYFAATPSMVTLANILLAHPQFKNASCFLLTGMEEFYNFVINNPTYFDEYID